MSTQVQSPLDFVAGVDASPPPTVGLTRLYAGADGRLYRRLASGFSEPLGDDTSDLLVGLGQVIVACRLLGFDPTAVDAETAMQALFGLL